MRPRDSAEIEERWVAAAEAKLGRRLPVSYRAEMQRHNGGTVAAAGEAWALHRIRDGTSPGTISRTYPDVIQQTAAAREWASFPAAALAIAANGAGDSLVFVGDEESFGAAVLWWDHETGVLVQVAEDFSELRANELPQPRGDLPLYDQTRGPRVAGVRVPGGPFLEPIPKPWKSIAPSGREAALYRLQLGKKRRCWVDLHAKPLRGLRPEQDWRSFTQLPDRGKLTTEEDTVDVEGRQLTLTWTQSSAWTPVIGWIRERDGGWHGQFYSEVSRLAGDIREIRRLVEAFGFSDPASSAGE